MPALLLHSMLVSLCAVNKLLEFALSIICVNCRDIPLHMPRISGSGIRRTWRYVHVGSTICVLCTPLKG